MKWLSWIPDALKLMGSLAPMIRGLIEAFETPGFGPEKKQKVLEAIETTLTELEVPSVIKTFILWMSGWLIDRIVKQLNEAGYFKTKSGGTT